MCDYDHEVGPTNGSYNSSAKAPLNLHESTQRIKSLDLEKRRRWGVGRGQCYIPFTIPNSNTQTFSPPISNLDHPQTPAFPLVPWLNGQTCF